MHEAAAEGRPLQRLVRLTGSAVESKCNASSVDAGSRSRKAPTWNAAATEAAEATDPSAALDRRLAGSL